MFRHGEVSTEVDSKPFLFTLFAFLGCGAASGMLFVLGRGSALSVFAGIMTGLVAVASLVVLFAMLTDYAYVDGEELVTRYLFKKKRIPFERIGRVTYSEKVYYVFGKGGEVISTVNGMLTGIDRIIMALENSGVRFE